MSSSITPLAFTGASKYSTDFQSILDRTVKIATQPISALQRQQSNILQQKQIAISLNGGAQAVSEAISDLGSLGETKALVANSSNSTKLSINSTNATAPATYTITDVTSIAHSSSATSSGFADSGTSTVSADGKLKLTFDGKDYVINLAPEKNNLTGLRDALNGLGIGLNSSILTTGTGATPYNLSITADTSGNKPITLADGETGAGANLISTSDPGANTEFKINGVAISKSSVTINDVLPGVSFSLNSPTASGETITITVGSSRSSLASKLKTFVDAYNSLSAQADGQIGENAGLLTGDVIVREIQNSLRSVVGFQGSSSLKGLSNIGVSFAADGKASFDQSSFDSLSDTQIQKAFTFLGSKTTGFGQLSKKFTQISDPVSGLIALQENRYDVETKRLSNRISDLTERVDNLQKATARRLQTYDALLAQLESQGSIISASYSALNQSLFGNKN